MEKKNILSQDQRKVVAFHESGHAVVSWFLEGGSPLLKVFILILVNNSSQIERFSWLRLISAK